MHWLLLAVIVLTGALAIAKRLPYNVATWVVVGLTVFGIFTSPDVVTRLMFVGAAILGPVLLYLLQLVLSLTIRPLIHYLRWSTDAHRGFFNVAPEDPLYSAAGEQLDRHAESLVSSGFVRRGRVGLLVEKTTVVNEFFDRGEGTEWAILTATIPAGVQPVILHCTCSFADGEILAVNNYAWVDPFPPSPGFENIRLPSIGDINDLVRACLTLAGRSTHGPVIATPLDTDMATRVKDRTKFRYDAEVRSGFLRYDAVRDVYRVTLRGAYRMHWVSVPPLRWIIERRDLARERELLAEMRLTPAARTDTSPGKAESATKEPSGKQKTLSLAAALALIAFIVFMPDLPDAIFGDQPITLVKPTVNVPGDFAVPDSFSGAVQSLEQLVRQPSHQLMGTRDDEPTPTFGVAISMRNDSADAFVDAVQDAFLAKGFYLFRTGERATSGLETDALALYPAPDPYEIMRAMETNAWNYDISTEGVIEWFRQEEARYPIRFTVIGFDYAGGTLLSDVPDETEFAARFIRFCPETQSEGPVSARQLGRDLKRSREVFCWWD